MPDIQSIVTDLLVILFQVLVYFLIRKVIIPWAQAHVSAKDMETFQSVALIAVRAVEQMAANNQLGLADKFQKAVMLARDQLKTRNLDLSDDQWKTVIEAAVRTLKAGGEEVKQAVTSAGSP